MSIIATGTSMAIAYGASALITLIGALTAGQSTVNKSVEQEKNKFNKNRLGESFKESEKLSLKETFTIENEFETAFTDEKILNKTLQEHGCTDFQYYENGVFTCTLEGMNLEFSKESVNSNYKMIVKCNEDELLKSFCEELSEEYTGNTQEETYNKIKDRLKQKNLEISQEELMEDDSIVLTINLD